MLEQKSTRSIRQIGNDEPGAIETATDILANAFRSDPVMLYFLANAESENQDFRRRDIVSALICSHMASGHALWGYYQQDQLVGCALLSEPSNDWNTLKGILACWRKWSVLPIKTILRLNAYGAISQKGNPKDVTHFIVMIGIINHARGQGHGRKFLQGLEQSSPKGSLWALDTENPSNVKLYEHLGYQLYDQINLKGICVYKFKKQLLD